MNLSEKIKELIDCVEDGDITFLPHENFIKKLNRHLDLNNIEGELTQWTQIYIEFLWEKYCEGRPWLVWMEYLEEIDMTNEWFAKEAEREAFNQKYGFDDDEYDEDEE